MYSPETCASTCTGTIVNVSKAAGDSVAEDEVIAQIETDKVTIDVRAPHAGTLSDILVRSQPLARSVDGL
jgi:2-oxoglutarate dehydrogenase E2 component (dihydrolipoamide succinyltransferase)